MIKKTEKGELMLAMHRQADFKLARGVIEKYAYLFERGESLTAIELAKRVEHKHPEDKGVIDFLTAYGEAYSL